MKNVKLKKIAYAIASAIIIVANSNACPPEDTSIGNNRNGVSVKVNPYTSNGVISVLVKPSNNEIDEKIDAPIIEEEVATKKIEEFSVESGRKETSKLTKVIVKIESTVNVVVKNIKKIANYLRTLLSRKNSAINAPQPEVEVADVLPLANNEEVAAENTPIAEKKGLFDDYSLTNDGTVNTYAELLAEENMRTAEVAMRIREAEENIRRNEANMMLIAEANMLNTLISNANRCVDQIDDGTAAASYLLLNNNDNSNL
jgi:hypothetical protein